MLSDSNILLSKIKSGDYIAFELVFKKFQPKLFKIAYSILKENEKAHEIVHDVFLKLWKNRRSVEVKKTLEAYLVVKVKSYSLNALRKKLKEQQIVSETDIGFFQLETEFYQDEEITDKIISDKYFEWFDKTVSELPEQQQKIFKLSRIDGLSANEIAEKINLTKRTVETHIYNALKTIKSKLHFILDKS